MLFWWAGSERQLAVAVRGRHVMTLCARISVEYSRAKANRGPNIEFHEDVSRRPCLPKAREVGGDLDYAAEQKSSIPAILAVGFHRVIGICSEALLGT